MRFEALCLREETISDIHVLRVMSLNVQCKRTPLHCCTKYIYAPMVFMSDGSDICEKATVSDAKGRMTMQQMSWKTHEGWIWNPAPKLHPTFSIAASIAEHLYRALPSWFHWINYISHECKKSSYAVSTFYFVKQVVASNQQSACSYQALCVHKS